MSIVLRGVIPLAQLAEVLSGFYSDVPAGKVPYLDNREKLEGNPIVFLMPEPLQDFGKYEIAGKDKLLA